MEKEETYRIKKVKRHLYEVVYEEWLDSEDDRWFARSILYRGSYEDCEKKLRGLYYEKKEL